MLGVVLVNFIVSGPHPSETVWVNEAAGAPVATNPRKVESLRQPNLLSTTSFIVTLSPAFSITYDGKVAPLPI